MALSLLEIVELLLVGLAAGVLGGLLGIGGSIVMLPALVILFGGREWGGQHLWQASAMLVNVVIAFPSARKHARSGAFRRGMFVRVVPATLVMIVVGVLVSEGLSGSRLQQVLAGFMGYVSVMTAWKVLRGLPDHEESESRVTWVRGSVVGGVMGFLAGLLGIGGAIIATPLMQVFCRAPLRNAIAVSAMVMCVTSPVGAGLKVAGVTQHGHAWWAPWAIFACLAPSAVVGSVAGASLSHRLPLRGLRLVFSVVLGLAAVRMFVGGMSSGEGGGGAVGDGGGTEREVGVEG